MRMMLVTVRQLRAAGVPADVILALVEAYDAKAEKRSAKRRKWDREYKRRVRAESARRRQMSTRTRVDRPEQTPLIAAAIPPAAGPQSAEPQGIESVDNPRLISKEGLTKQGGSNDASLSSFLPLFDESSNPQEKKEVDTRARGAALFAKFWQAYPHKVGKRDAANCFQRVLKSGIVGIDDLMAGLARYAAKTDDRPWCNPATWLNGGRWDDQPAAVNGNHQTNGGGSGFQTNRGAGGAVRMRIALARQRAAASDTDQEEGGFAAPLQSRD
jgi:hypothetical protein